MKNNAAVLIIISLLFLILERFLLNNDSGFTRLMEFQLVIIWAIAQYLSYKKFGLFSLFNLFLFGMFFFSIGAVLHFLISGNDIRNIERGFGNISFSYRTIQEALWAYSVFIFLSYNTYNYLFRKNFHKMSSVNNICGDEQYFLIGKILMLSFLVIQLYKGYLFYNAFNENRAILYLYGSMANPIPTWVRFLAYFFEVGYYFILASVPNISKFKKYSILYFVVLIPDIMIGNRGMFGAFILFYLWYYFTYYKKLAIKLRTTIFLGVCMLIIFQIMEFMRDGWIYGFSSISLTEFLVNQGVSFYILPIYIDYADNIQYYLYPFVLYNILGGFTGYSGQSIEVLEHNCGVGHQLMYTVDPNYYLAGGSFGSSNITEMYDAGIIGFILLSIFFSYMIIFFEKKFVTNRFIRFMSYILIIHFILSPRGSYFPSIYGFVKLYIFYKVILFFMSKIIIRK